MNEKAKAALIAAFLITGAINTLTKKFQFQTCSFTPYDLDMPQQVNGCPPGQRHFTKPWSQNLCMFIGESLLYLLYLHRRKLRGMKTDSLSVPLTPSSRSSVPFMVFLAPACCDVLATGLGGVGMLYISASVWQMMRGSVIVFTSLFSVFCLGRKLYAYNWLAVSVAVCGLCLVGFSAVLDGGADSSDILVGIVFTVGSQFFAAIQMVTEELFVKKYHAQPEQVVGSEGVWGIMIMVTMLIVMYFVPGTDAGGSFENAIDSWELITNSGALAGLVLFYLVSISFFNFLGVTISKQLSAVHRTINDALRTAIVWGVQLGLFYAGSTLYGQGPTPHSWMQLVGFLFLIAGSLINHQVVKVPGLSYPGAERQLRPMGMAMSPTAQTVSVLSVGPGSPLASPNASPYPSPMTEKYDAAETDANEVVLVEDNA